MSRTSRRWRKFARKRPRPASHWSNKPLFTIRFPSFRKDPPAQVVFVRSDPPVTDARVKPVEAPKAPAKARNDPLVLAILSAASEDTRRLNPHIFEGE